MSGGLGGRGASTGKSVGDTGCRTSVGGWYLLLGYRVLISRLFPVNHLLPPLFTIQYESGFGSLHWIYSGFCSTCIEDKMTQERSREPRVHSKVPLELVHTDLVGLIDPISKDGFRSAIAFTNDNSGAVFVYFLKTKN